MNIARSSKTWIATIALVAGGFAGNVHAVDGMSVVYGSGEGGDNVDMARVGMQWNWDKTWFDEGSWELTGYWELDMGYWDGKDSTATTQSSLLDIGITPVFRFQKKASGGSIQPYIEGGIGAHLLSDSRINDKDMSTSFQFGDHVGLGVVFGEKQEWDLSYRLQHFSNAGLDTPNPGINFHQLRVSYRFN